MRTLINSLIVFSAFSLVATASAVQAEDKASQTGVLVIRNGSEFATLSVTVYRLEDGRKSAIKEASIPPTTSQMYSLSAGDYSATFDVANATASAADGRFSLGAGEDYTINFHAKGKR